MNVVKNIEVNKKIKKVEFITFKCQAETTLAMSRRRRSPWSLPPLQGPHMPDDGCLSGTRTCPDHCGKIHHFWESNSRLETQTRLTGPSDPSDE